MIANTTTFRFPDRPFTLIGRSRAGEGTSWAIPELRWILDCGALVQGWKPSHVFVTHTHSDHVHFLTHMVMMRNDGTSGDVGNGKKKATSDTTTGNNSITFNAKAQSPPTPPLVILPAKAEPLVRLHLQTYQAMVEGVEYYSINEPTPYSHNSITDCDNNHDEDDTNSSSINNLITMQPAQAGEEILLKQKCGEFICRTLECDHRIVCLGFSFFERRRYLRDEYAGKTGEEIRSLRREGLDIYTHKEEPLLCFLGDTTEVVFERYPLLLKQHKIVMVECSFLKPKDRAKAMDWKHMHWDALRPYVKGNPNTLFLLTHFSLKHKSLELRNFFRDVNNLDMNLCRNVHPMVLEDEVKTEWIQSGQTGPPPTCNCFACVKSQIDEVKLPGDNKKKMY